MIAGFSKEGSGESVGLSERSGLDLRRKFLIMVMTLNDQLSQSAEGYDRRCCVREEAAGQTGQSMRRPWPRKRSHRAWRGGERPMRTASF